MAFHCWRPVQQFVAAACPFTRALFARTLWACTCHRKGSSPLSSHPSFPPFLPFFPRAYSIYLLLPSVRPSVETGAWTVYAEWWGKTRLSRCLTRAMFTRGERFQARLTQEREREREMYIRLD